MATYYWVGDSGNWDATTTTNWATSSGGTGGAGVPTSADDVIFDANSNTGTGAFTVTVTGTSAAPAVCRDFSTGGAGGALDGAMTLSQGATSVLDVYGSMTLPATNFTWSGTSGNRIRFRATTTGKTITTNGVTIGGGTNTQLEFTGSGGEWTLGSALTITGSVLITQGTFRTANFNVTTSVNFFHTSSIGTQLTRAVYLGSSTISTTGTFGAITVGTLTNITFDAGTSQINCPNSGANFLGGGLTYYNVSFTNTGGGVATITGANTFNNLTFTTTSATGIRRVSIGDNQTINGTLTLGAANTAIRRVQLFSDVVGTARTVTVNGTLATLADVDFRDITAAGTVATPWTGTRLGNGGNVTNITTATPKTVYRVGTGNWSATQWSTSSGGAVDVNNLPLAQDTAIFDTGTVTGTHTIDLNWWIGNFDCSALNVAVTLSTGQSPVIHGNFTLDADITLTGAGQFVFSGASNQTIISAGRTITQQPIVIKPTTTSLLLGDALTTSVGFFLTQGTLNLNGYDLSCGAFASGNSNVRSIAFGTNKVIITGNNTTVVGFSPSTNFTYTGSGQFECTYSGSTGTRQFAAATGVTESNAVNIKITAGTDAVQTFSAHSFNNLDFTGFSGTLVNNARNIYGNLTFSSGMTIDAGTNATTFLKSIGTQTLTSAGKTIDFPITKEAAGTLTLGDSLTIGSTRTLTLTQGTISQGAFNLTTGLFSSTGSTTRQLDVGTGTFTNSGATFTVSGTNFSTAGTGTISMTSGSSKTFAGGSFSYPTLNQGGAGELIITGTNTFARLSNSVNGTTITFPNVTTNVADWKVNGVVGSVTTIQRTGASGTFTLNYTGSGRVEADYLSISNSTVTPSNTWFAGTRSTNGGGNTGWSFTFTTGTRYWVGGSGNWDASTTTNWAVASGGTGGVPAPTATDSVIFDANSNSGTSAFTVTVTGTSASPAVCNDFSTGGYWGALDGALTFTMGATAFLDVYGSMTLPATNFSVSGTTGAGIRYKATTTGKTITTNGVSLGNVTITFDGVGGGWTLGSAYTSAQAITLTNGSFDTANFNVTALGFLSTNSNIRNITLGSSTLTFSAVTNAPFAWDITTTTNLTFNAGTSQINLSGFNTTFNGGGLTYYNVACTSNGGPSFTTISGANTFNNFTHTTPTGATVRTITLSSNQTINGNFTLGAINTAFNRVYVRSDIVGTARTITVNGTLSTLADVDFRDVTAAGAVATPWTGTRLGNCGGNSNITFPAAKTVYRVGTSSTGWSTANTWALTSGGTGDTNNFPLAQDTAVFDTNTATGTYTINSNYNIGTLDMSALNVAVTLATGTTTPTFYGNVTLDADVTLTGTGAISFSGASNQTVTSAGRTFTQAITINKPTTTSLLLGDAMTIESSRTFTLTQGTLDLGGYDLSCGLFSSSNSNVRSIAFGSKKIFLTGANGLLFNTATNFTYTGTGLFEQTYTGASPTDFSFGQTAGATETNVVSVNVSTGTATIRFLGAFKDINLTGFAGTYGASASVTIYGNLTLSNLATYSASTAATTFSATSGIQQITSNGVTLDRPLTKQAAGTLTLGDSLTIGSTRTLTHTGGTINLGTFNLTTGLYSSTGSTARQLNVGSGTFTNSGATFTVSGSNFTTAGTGTISMTSGSSKTFAGGGFSYPKLNQGGSGTLTITGANSFADITATVQPSTITFPASTTTTVKDFSVSGTLGNLVTLNSSTPGTRWTLFATGLVSCSYVSISDSNGTPPFLDYGEGSVNAGNNVGWVFALRSSITEAVTNTDSENFDLYIFRDISEDSGLADVNQSQGDFNSEAIELVEMLGAEESVSAIFNSDISENAVVDDIALGPAVFNSSLTEPLTSNETQDRILVISRSITENSTPADVEDRTLTIYRDIVQNLVSGANEGNTNNVFNPSILENSTVVDIATGRGWFKINDAQNPNWVDVDDNQ